MKKNKKEPKFSPELLDQLFGDYKNPGDWNKVEDQLKALKGALVERALSGELTHHLGYSHGSD